MKSVLLFLFTFSFVACTAQEPLTQDEMSLIKRYTSVASIKQNPENVIILDLRKSKLKEIPQEVFACTNLEELYLNKNRLKFIPAEIGQLKNLKKVDFSNNKLKTLPEEIGDLSQLTHLLMNRNLIEELPYSIGKLKKLEVIEMWDNEIIEFPDSIGELKKLQVFELRNILFSKEEQAYLKALLPNCKFYFSPPCNCSN
ncbi:MAG: leucine-rich repeat domain-containing protein [Bacteroidia bacterium]|nr:leucine-rich repeat domain-containing protein [Bacteroidia bacterium]